MRPCAVEAKFPFATTSSSQDLAPTKWLNEGLAMSKFYKYFRENMEALGLVPPPQSLFGTQQLAIGTISTLLGCIGAHHFSIERRPSMMQAYQAESTTGLTGS
jgi:hypothetical protein